MKRFTTTLILMSALAATGYAAPMQAEEAPPMQAEETAPMQAEEAAPMQAEEAPPMQAEETAPMQAEEAEETQEAPAVAVLKKIVVTATAEPEEHRNVTANLQVIDADEIRKSGAFNLSGLLRSRSSVFVNEQPGNWTKIIIRGFRTGKAASTTLQDESQILIDGNRSGTGNINNIPLAGIERVEILRGPAAVLYGSSSVGGIVNIITKKGRGKPTGAIEAAYGSNDFRSFSAGVSLGVDDDRFGFAVAGKQQGANDYNVGGAGLHRYKNTAYQKAGGVVTAAFRPVEHSEINAVGIYNTAYDTGSPGYLPNNLSPNDSVKNRYSYGSLSYASPTDKSIRIKLDLYTNENKYESIGRGEPPFGNWNTTITGQTIGAKAILGLTLPKVEETSLGNLAFGTEYLSSRFWQNGDIGEPESQADVLAFFGEYVVDIGPVTLRAGIRYDHYTMDVDSNEWLNSQARSRDFEQLTWSLGGIWHIMDWLGLRASIGTAYVPPTLMQLVGNYNAYEARWHGNDKLDAQKSLTWDTGFEFEKFGFNSSIGYFHTEFEDRIITVFSDNWADAYYVNQGKQYIAGLEFKLRYDGSFDFIGAPLNISPYFNMEYLTERSNSGTRLGSDTATRIRNLPEYTGSAGVNFAWRIFALDLNMEFVGRQFAEDRATSELKTFDGFNIFNARFTVEPVEKLFVYAGVNNMEDKRYGYLPEYPMPGRTFYGGVRFEF